MQGSRGHQSIRFIYLRGQYSEGDKLSLSEEKFHHLYKVLRYPDSAQVIASNGLGSTFQALLERTSKHQATVEIQKLISSSVTSAKSQIQFAVGISKNPTMEFIIEKAAELNVRRVQPLVMERSVVRVAKGEAEKYRQKLQKIAEEALEQSQSAWLTQVDLPVTIEEFLANKPEVLLFSSENREQLNMKDSFSLIQKNQKPSAFFVIGPEGGISRDENDNFVNSGAKTVSLGESILRVETAFLAAATLVKLALL